MNEARGSETSGRDGCRLIVPTECELEETLTRASSIPGPNSAQKNAASDRFLRMKPHVIDEFRSTRNGVIAARSRSPIVETLDASTHWASEAAGKSAPDVLAASITRSMSLLI